MRKFLLFLQLALIILSIIVIRPPQSNAYVDCNASEDDLPLIPTSVNNTTIDRTGTIQVTLHFDQMSSSDLARYDTFIIMANVYDAEGNPIFTNAEDTNLIRSNRVNSVLTLSNAPIIEATSGTLRVGIRDQNCDGGLETPATNAPINPIQINVNTDTNARIPEGEQCDPNKQNDPNNPQFQCEEGFSCEESSVAGERGQYYCGGKEGIPINGSCFSPEILIHACPDGGEKTPAEACTGDEEGQVKCSDLETVPCLEKEGDPASVVCWKSKTTKEPTPTPPFPPCSGPNYTYKTNDDGELVKEMTGCNSVATGIGKSFTTLPSFFIEDIFGILLSISGGIALLLIIRSGYQIMTSKGDPEQLKEARERLTSAIIGLLFLLFSLVILQVMGVDILKIPGLSS